jgi:membrane fusion protein (multidrug efflux system)
MMRVAARTIATFLLATLAACEKAEQDDTTVQAVVNVRTATVVQQPFTETIGAIGVVAGRPGHVASLSAPTPARVARVAVALGQHVARGATLVELDQTPYASAAHAADATLAAAQRNYDRTERLVTEGISPRKDLEQATAELERARADAANAQQQQAYSVIRAPIGGVITRLDATLGAMADPSQVLVEVADPSALDIMFSVSPSQAGRIAPGMKVTLSAGQSASGEPLGIATVVDVGGIVDVASRGVTIRAQAPTTRRPLRIGETVFGEIVSTVNARALVVPVEALVPDADRFRVFVVDNGGTARAREVQVGARTDKLAEILSGLTAGERVVTYGAYGIEDSAKVVIMAPAAPQP